MPRHKNCYPECQVLQFLHLYTILKGLGRCCQSSSFKKVWEHWSKGYESSKPGQQCHQMTHGGGRGPKIIQKNITYYLNSPKTEFQIEEDREYERVLYDNLTLRQMMANVREAKIEESKEIEAKEKEFETKLVTGFSSRFLGKQMIIWYFEVVKYRYFLFHILHEIWPQV